MRTQSSDLCCRNIVGRIRLEIELLAGLNMLCLWSESQLNSRATNLERRSQIRVSLPSISISFISPASHKAEPLKLNAISKAIQLHQRIVTQLWFSPVVRENQLPCQITIICRYTLSSVLRNPNTRSPYRASFPVYIRPEHSS